MNKLIINKFSCARLLINIEIQNMTSKVYFFKIALFYSWKKKILKTHIVHLKPSVLKKFQKQIFFSIEYYKINTTQTFKNSQDRSKSTGIKYATDRHKDINSMWPKEENCKNRKIQKIERRSFSENLFLICMTRLCTFVCTVIKAIFTKNFSRSFQL